MTALRAAADTGRIKAPLASKAQRLYYGAPDDDADRHALRLISRVDRAHLVMLAEQRLIPREQAATLLRTVTALEADGFAAALSRPRPRGLYLAYEATISDLRGPDAGGLLHTGRSRNDLSATTMLLSLRAAGTKLVSEGCRLLTALLCRAQEHVDVVMAIHTHFQPAMPITYGYYLTGVALALHRDLDRVIRALRSIHRCPLGAHAVAGTDLELDCARTADLLGFDAGPLHAVDAVASRDVALELLGIASGLVITVSRLAADLQLWSTSELGYVHFPDWLVGSSSAMPQKRNAFLLEYLKARPSQVLGAWVTAITAMKSAPFTNSIEVGTEAAAAAGPALRTAGEVLAVAALVCSGARPQADRARTAAQASFVDATALANELVRRGVPFRAAHERVGSAVLATVEDGAAWPPPGLPAFDVETAVDSARIGGGPGNRASVLATAWRSRATLHRDHEQLREAERRALGRLDLAVGTVCRG